MDLNRVRLSREVFSVALREAAPRNASPIDPLRRSQLGEYDGNRRRSLPSKPELVAKKTREPRRVGAMVGSWLRTRDSTGLDKTSL